MRFGLMGAAAAALLATSPAGAVSLLVQPQTGNFVITSGERQSCQLVPFSCTTTSATVSNSIRDFVFGVPTLNGTYAFGPITDGASANGGAFFFSGFLSFAADKLVTDRIDFTYRQTILNGNVSAIDTTIAGFINNFQVRNLDTGQFLAPVPEPATWALMLAGFGLVGFAMRRRRVTTRVAFA